MYNFKYKHDYYKQNISTHTTVRGLQLILKKRVKKGDIVRETYPSKLNFCEVHSVTPRAIKDLSIEFLKADCEYEGFTISSHEEFCKLINSFLPPFYQQATPESTKTVVVLKIIEGMSYEVLFLWKKRCWVTL